VQKLTEILTVIVALFIGIFVWSTLIISMALIWSYFFILIKGGC
jgi:hypothetical protein